MDKHEMLKHIKRFRGSSTWIAGQLKVTQSAFSQWLHGRKTNGRLDAAVPPLVDRILETGGACLFDVNGKSVRSQVRKIRGRKGKK